MPPVPARGRTYPGRRRSIERDPSVTLHVINFKSIASVELPPVRLTVLAGSNSSGKSSLLQSALFFVQSTGQRAAVINGDLVRLGEPKDVIRDGTDDVSFEVQFPESDPEGGKAVVAVRTTLQAVGQDLGAAAVTLAVDGEVHLDAIAADCPPDLRTRLTAAEVALRIQNPGRLDLPEEAFLTVLGLQPGRLIYRASEQAYRDAFDQLLKEVPDVYVLEEILLDQRETEVPEPLLERLAELRRGRPRRARRNLSKSERDALFQLYLKTEAPGGWASEAITTGTRRGSVRGFHGMWPGRRAPGGAALAAASRMIDAVRRMDGFAQTLTYLGPLRDDPRVAYPLGHTVANLPVGEKGEFTAAYLESNQSRRITYTSPEGRSRSDYLPAAVSQWCSYLGIAETVDVQSRGKLGHELELEVHGHPRDPTAIGVGASQLLPVVVLVLGAAPGALILLEQPELHLHPKVQSRLADFFAWARPDVRLLVETHSEYLITRLRLRAAQGALEATELAVLFASQRVIEHVIEIGDEQSTEEEVFSEFRRLGIDEQGDFDAWPEDFFDTLADDTKELARAVASRLRDSRGSD